MQITITLMCVVLAVQLPVSWFGPRGWWNNGIVPYLYAVVAVKLSLLAMENAVFGIWDSTWARHSASLRRFTASVLYCPSTVAFLAWLYNWAKWLYKTEKAKAPCLILFKICCYDKNNFIRRRHRGQPWSSEHNFQQLFIWSAWSLYFKTEFNICVFIEWLCGGQQLWLLRFNRNMA